MAELFSLNNINELKALPYFTNCEFTAMGLEVYGTYDKYVVPDEANPSFYLARRYRRGRMNGTKKRLPSKGLLVLRCGVRGAGYSGGSTSSLLGINLG